jgi:hypothetical protein
MNTNSTEGSVEPNVFQRYGFIIRWVGPMAMAAGCLVIGGWLMGIRALASVMPSFVTMKPNTAFSFCPGRVIALALAPSGKSSR